MRPLFADWNNFLDEDKSDWNTIDSYLSDNTIDDSKYKSTENTDYDAIRLFIIESKPQPEPTRTLSDLIKDGELNDILGSRFPDGSGFSPSGQPLDAFNVFSTQREENVNLIPSSMISSRPFRLATLASIGYGPNFRFYR